MPRRSPGPRHPRDWLPCPDCGGESVASIADHSGAMCEDSYRYCIRCGEIRARSEPYELDDED